MRNQKGFTLIELMIVVIILGILAAILIPRFMGAQERARCKAAVADVSIIREGLGLYFVEYGEFPQVAVTYNALAGFIAPYVSPPRDNVTFTFEDYTSADPYDDYVLNADIVNVPEPDNVHATADTILSTPY